MTTSGVREIASRPSGIYILRLSDLPAGWASTAAAAAPPATLPPLVGTLRSTAPRHSASNPLGYATRPTEALRLLPTRQLTGAPLGALGHAINLTADSFDWDD